MRRAARLEASRKDMFAQTVWADPTATPVWFRENEGEEILSVYRCGATANWKNPKESVVVSTTQGKSEASAWTEAPEIGVAEPLIVTYPWIRPFGPEAHAGATVTRSRTIAVNTADEIDTRTRTDAVAIGNTRGSGPAEG